jgi:hypothetical protein
MDELRTYSNAVLLDFLQSLLPLLIRSMESRNQHQAITAQFFIQTIVRGLSDIITTDMGQLINTVTYGEHEKSTRSGPMKAAVYQTLFWFTAQLDHVDGGAQALLVWFRMCLPAFDSSRATYYTTPFRNLSLQLLPIVIRKQVDSAHYYCHSHSCPVLLVFKIDMAKLRLPVDRYLSS